MHRPPAPPPAAPSMPPSAIDATADEDTLATATLDHRRSSMRSAAANFKSLAPQSPTHYRRISIAPAVRSLQEDAGAANLRRAVALRERWVYRRNVPEWYGAAKCQPSSRAASALAQPPYDPFETPAAPPTAHVFHWQRGVVHVYADKDAAASQTPLIRPTTLADFAHDLVLLSSIMNDPDTRSFCHRRLERLAQIAVPHRDFYNVSKVDVHVHHSSMTNQKHFLTFIKRKVKREGGEKVLANREDPNAWIRLMCMRIIQSSTDSIASTSSTTRLGKYLAELTHEVFSDLESTKYQNSEYRISIYGRDIKEWDKLGDWFLDHKVFSPNVRWLIQIPRLYNIYKEMGRLNSFQDMLDNIFTPIFEATVDPTSHPKVASLLQQIVGFDSVDDESQPQPRVDLRKCGPPETWNSNENPPYSYYSFFIYSNLAVLNQLRESKGLNTFTYRPHAGEAGDIDHLATSFLLAHGINHGLNLKKSPVLQYLFYVTQIGVAMSPLSNNALFCEIAKNPLPSFFKRGLNVTLSTDDPLQFAFTREPLMEEYSVAAQVWKLSNTDLCELARNSVLQSGFEPCVKANWLGSTWYLCGQAGNDISKTNVPSIRLCYRYETLLEELKIIYDNRVPDDIHVLPTFSYKRGHITTKSTGHDERKHRVQFATEPMGHYSNGDIHVEPFQHVDDFDHAGLSEDEEIDMGVGDE
ncbi:AMP deaminase [Gracilaria domingensis]|nr:AMP deaminase [Gracilaria domingensis]